MSESKDNPKFFGEVCEVVVFGLVTSKKLLIQRQLQLKMLERCLQCPGNSSEKGFISWYIASVSNGSDCASFWIARSQMLTC